MSLPRALKLILATTPVVAGIVACGGDTDSTRATVPVSTTTAPAATGSGTMPSELRDVRYCEVIPSVSDGTNVTTYVYNTLGMNYCPAEQWRALTEDEVNQEYGSQSAKLNGPRHWVLDQIEASGASTTGETFTFGGIDTLLRGTLSTPANQATVGDQFYVPSQVERTTVWHYDAGKAIFQLTDPSGNVYVMQSYAQIADPALTMKQLPDLADKLALPTGWTYSSETLTEDLELNSDGLAVVVNDNLYNSYQRK